MRVVIPEDYQRGVQSLDRFQLLEGFDVQVYHDHASYPEVLVERFTDADALVLTRERTRIDATPTEVAQPDRMGRAAYRSAGLPRARRDGGRGHPRALCMPHLGYVERHSYAAYFGEAFANVRAFFAGQRKD